MPFCDTETGDYKHLLVEGGISEQPYITYKYLDLIKLNYKLYTAEAREKKAAEIQAKQKRSRARGHR